MTALLAITAVLLLISGGVKVRSGVRVGLGVHLLTLVELAFALIIGFAAISGLGADATIAWMAPAGVVTVVVSSGLFSARMRGELSRRAELEAARLEAYVKYFYRAEDASDPEE